MQIKYFIPLIVLFILSSNLVSACPPSTSAFLFVEDTTKSSDELTFLDTNLQTQNYSQRYKTAFPSFRYFEFTGNPTNLIISFDGNEIFNSEINTLKTELRRFNHNTQEWRNIPTYEFPSQAIFEGIYKKTDEGFDLQKYNGSIITIYLDDELVREFILGYEPSHIYNCPTYGELNYINYTIFGVIALIVVSAIIFVIIKKRKK